MEKKHGALTDKPCTEKKTNYNSIDLFKFIMAIFVVAIHTEPFYYCENELFKQFFSELTACAVPFFFMASGYLLARKLNSPYCSEENQRVVISYLKKIIKMYLVWTAIYFPLAIYDYHLNGYSVPYCILITIRKIIFRGQNYNSWMLWYLLATIYASVVILATMKLKFKSKTKCLPVIALVMIVVCSIINKISWSEHDLPAVLELVKKLIMLTITDGSVLSGITPISFGILAYGNEKFFKPFAWLLIPCFAVLLISDNELIAQIVGIIKNFAVFGLALNITLKDRPIYKTLRLSSTIIYLIHMYINTFVCFILYKEMKAGPLVFVLTASVSIAVSLLYLFISNRFKTRKQL